MNWLGILVFLSLLLLPFLAGVLLVYFGSRVTQRIRNGYARAATRTFIAAVALTPAVLDNAGLLPAWWVLVAGPSESRLSSGLKPICIVWAILFCIAGLRQYFRQRSQSAVAGT